jgi:ligand-binding sensor domain-containing protein
MLKFHHSQRLMQGSLACLCLILWFVTGALTTLYSQPIFFNTITQQDGLRNGNVRSIVKDFQGFVWIGTEDGLHRYDGNQMKIYRNREGDSLSISSNFILSLYEDSKHNLWIGTLDGGLCIYDRGLDNFRRYIFEGDTKTTNRGVRTIEEGNDNYLYVGSDNMFRAKISELWEMRFDKVHVQKDSASTAGTRVLSIVQAENPNLLVSVNTRGLFKYNVNTGESSIHPISKITEDIQSLFIDKRRNVVWAGTWRDGLLAYDQSTNQYRWFRSEGKDAVIKSNFIASIAGDSEGNIWIGTDNGLTLIPPDTNIWKTTLLTTYLQDQEDRSGIQGTVVKTVYVDDKDLVWVGMYYEGVNVYDRKAMNFGSLPIAIGEGSAIKFGNINALAEDKDKGLWLGVDGGGLFYLEGKLGETHSTLKSIPCKNADKIKSLKVDHEGNLWIGTWGHGVTFVKSNTRTCEELPLVNSLVGREVLSINVDRSDNTWIGTFDKGLFRYNSRDKKITKITRKEDDGNCRRPGKYTLR